jgi:predicted TIM-barrel fold metal-dependent hydrolase
LHADGVILLANYKGKYLGDGAFEPVWAELDRHRAVVSVRPGQPPLPPASGLAGPLVDYPFDTTRTAVQLVLNGIADQYPGARVILAHAGGFLPYASHRFAELARVFRRLCRNIASSRTDEAAELRRYNLRTLQRW